MICGRTWTYAKRSTEYPHCISHQDLWPHVNLCKKDVNNIREIFYLKPIHILEDEIWPLWCSNQPILRELQIWPLKYVKVANIEKGNMEFRELLCIFYWYAPKFNRILLNTKPNPLFQSCQGHPKLEVSSMPISFLFPKLFWSYNTVKPDSFMGIIDKDN